MTTSINLKILILGDCAVGKTSLLLRYTDDNFSESHISTIGVEYKIKSINVNGKTIKLQIWDTSGQERFRSITKNFFRNADGVLFVYDITNKETFSNIKMWLQDAQNVENNFQKTISWKMKTKKLIFWKIFIFRCLVDMLENIFCCLAVF